MYCRQQRSKACPSPFPTTSPTPNWNSFSSQTKDISRRAEPDYPYIHHELARSGVTLTLLWEEYCEKSQETGQKPYMNTQFDERCRRSARVVSSIFRKMVCRLWCERSQPAMEVSSRAASRCFMFMYFLLPHWVPATWRSRAQTNIRAELPSGKLPTTRVRRRISRFSARWENRSKSAFPQCHPPPS